ncbi:hypothetical protein [Flavobacterium sp. MK4S-17]|uniref:hypothetical protein n=1 Tax=Flavobacterium sp. MK4S-17 TaxID=2543737 RepID=UPI0013598FA7|nr:hypothetical protein [Flavobacterium sp. MK4S-17]
MGIRIKISLFWGLTMFFIMCIALPLLDGDKITFIRSATGLVIFLSGGFIFGSLIKIKQKPKNNQDA